MTTQTQPTELSDGYYSAEYRPLTAEEIELVQAREGYEHVTGIITDVWETAGRIGQSVELADGSSVVVVRRACRMVRSAGLREYTYRLYTRRAA